MSVGLAHAQGADDSKLRMRLLTGHVNPNLWDDTISVTGFGTESSRSRCAAEDEGVDVEMLERVFDKGAFFPVVVFPRSVRRIV